MKIYLACALTHVPDSHFEQYTSSLIELAQKLKSLGHEVKCALENSDPQLARIERSHKASLCYIWDRNMVEWAELVIAESSFPSTGMGIELQLADNCHTPIILCFHDYGLNRTNSKKYIGADGETHNLQVGEGFISLMALGLPSLKCIIQYESESDLLNQILTGL